MKCLRLFFVTVFVGSLLCACQETPAEVKQNMREYGDNAQVKASEITYCSVEQLKEEKMPEITGSSLVLPNKVDFSGVEGVEVLHLSTEKNFLTKKNVDKYTTLFGVDKSKMEKMDSIAEDGWGKSLDYDSEKEQIYLDMIENGGMAYMSRECYDVAPNVVEKKYNMDREDLSKINVTLADGKANLSEICEKTEKWMEENMHIEGIQYKVSDVYVRKKKDTESKERLLSMCAEYEHKGIRFNYHTSSLSEQQEDFSEKRLSTLLAVELGVSDAGIPSFFSRNMNIRIDSAEAVNQIVDFKSAVNIVKETMSGFGTFHITEVLPLYTLNLKDNCEAPGAEIEARPVYAFLVTNQQEQYDHIAILKMNNCEHFFFVDMLTRELTTDLSIGSSG